MASKSPLQNVKDKFGDKAKLVEAVKGFLTDDLWVNRTNKNKGLEHISNAQLLRLHTLFTAVKSEFGSRAKLIDAIVDFEKRGKDEGFRKKLAEYPVPRLYDLHRSAKKRHAAEARRARPLPPR